MIEYSKEDFERFMLLRQQLFSAIEKALAESDHCKSYEGQFRASRRFPHYFEAKDNDLSDFEYELSLDCYVIGPRRHYCWSGNTFKEALDKAEKDILKWIRNDQS